MTSPWLKEWLARKALQEAEDAAKEAEEANFTYHAWMRAWRARNGHHGPYDPVTGLPIMQQAAE